MFFPYVVETTFAHAQTLPSCFVILYISSCCWQKDVPFTINGNELFLHVVWYVWKFVICLQDTAKMYVKQSVRICTSFSMVTFVLMKSALSINPVYNIIY